MADGFRDFVAGKIGSAAAIGRHAGKQIGSDGDVTGGGDFVGEFLGPIAQAKNFVDDQDDGLFVFRLGIDDESFDGAAVMLDGDPLAVARGFFELGLGPVLRAGCSGE